MKKLMFLFLMLLSFVGFAADKDFNFEDVNSQVLVLNKPAQMSILNIDKDPVKTTISQCEIECLEEFRSCLASNGNWFACELAYERCASNCN
jgi:uncharacterized protein YcfL